MLSLARDTAVKLNACFGLDQAKPTVTRFKYCSERSPVSACNRMSLGIACTKLSKIIFALSCVELLLDCSFDAHWIGQTNE